MDFRKPKTLLLSPLIVLASSFAILLIAFVLLTGTGSIKTYGVNKTIDWVWELSDIATVFAIMSILIFVFGYIFLWILRMRLNKMISIVNLCLLFVLPLVWTIEHMNYKCTLTFLTAVGVIISFIINTVLAIRYKLKDKQAS